MKQPCERHGDCYGEDECGPIAQIMTLYGEQDKLDMDEISLQTQHSKPCHALVEPLRCASEKAVEQDDSGHGERDIEHSLDEKREMSVPYLFEPDAAPQ